MLSSQDLVGKPFALILNKTDLLSGGWEGVKAYESRVHIQKILRERGELEEMEEGGRVGFSSDVRTVRIVGSSLDMSIASELGHWIYAVASN